MSRDQKNSRTKLRLKKEEMTKSETGNKSREFLFIISKALISKFQIALDFASDGTPCGDQIKHTVKLETISYSENYLILKRTISMRLILSVQT